MVAVEGLRMAGAGIVLGLAAAAVAARSLRTLLFEVDPADPVTFAGIVLLLLTVTAAACIVPARRAARLDPLLALRKDLTAAAIARMTSERREAQRIRHSCAIRRP